MLRTVLLARTLAMLWAGFWLLFFIVESLAWNTPLLVMASWTGVGLLFVLLAAVAWRWEETGGLLLVAAGALAGVAYSIWAPTHLPAMARAATTLVFSGPPLLAGILFFLHHRHLPR